VNDTTPPSIRVRRGTHVIGKPIRVAIRDSGSGVDPHALHAKIGKRLVRIRYAHGVLSIPTKGLRAGRHALVVRASDWQETKNMEDVGPVLPNTRVLHTTVRLRH
jgi:hypothetical protein